MNVFVQVFAHILSLFEFHTKFRGVITITVNFLAPADTLIRSRKFINQIPEPCLRCLRRPGQLWRQKPSVLEGKVPEKLPLVRDVPESLTRTRQHQRGQWDKLLGKRLSRGREGATPQKVTFPGEELMGRAEMGSAAPQVKAYFLLQRDLINAPLTRELALRDDSFGCAIESAVSKPAFVYRSYTPA